MNGEGGETLKSGCMQEMQSWKPQWERGTDYLLVAGVSFIWLLGLLALIWLTIYYYRRISKPAAWLQIPYALWVTFAGYLNFGIWFLNR